MATAARYCAIVTGFLQLLLALLSLWILVDLNVTGTPIEPVALVLSVGFVAAQIYILVLAWRLCSDSPRSRWSLVTIYSLGLAGLLGWFAIADLFNLSIDWTSLILRPGAVLPPNELFGRGWPIGLALMSAGAAILLGVLPLVCLGVVLLRESRKLRVRNSG